MNLLQQLKLRQLAGRNPRSVFDTSQGIGLDQRMTQGLFLNPPKKEPVNPMNPPDAVYSPGLAGLRGRSTPSMDEYKAYLRSGEPNKNDHQLSKIGKALAGVAGVAEGWNRGVGAGVQTGIGLMERPYEEAKENYRSKGGRLKELAGLEYQGLGDEQKLEVAILENEREARKDFFNELKTMSGIDMDEAQAANLYDQMQARGWTQLKNETTGAYEMYNSKTGERRSLGKMFETPGEKRTFEFNDFLRREGIEQQNEKELENIRQAGRTTLERLRQSGDMRLATFKNDLETKAGLKPGEIKTAQEAASAITLLKNPDLKTALYDTVDGKLVMKDAPDPAAHALFMEKLQQNMNSIVGYEFAPANTAPFIRNDDGSISFREEAPTTGDPLNDAALKYLRDNEYEETPEAIAEARKLIQEQAAGSVNIPAGQPQVVNPEQSMPAVNLPPSIPTRPILQNMGQPTSPQAPNWEGVRFTDLMRRIGQVPQGIYGNAPGLVDRNRLR